MSQSPNCELFEMVDRLCYHVPEIRGVKIVFVKLRNESMSDQAVMLTGSGGFLGSHLKSALPEPLLCPRSTELNLLDYGAVEKYLHHHSPATIIHAAGFVGGIGLNKAHPGRMISDNLRMGLNIIEAAAHHGGIHVCVVSTVCVYPHDASVPTPETSMYQGYPADDTAFYGIAKRTLHTACEGLRREFGLSYSYVIPTNLYGPGDYFDEKRSHVVPALIRRAVEAKENNAPELVVWGDGTQTRDLLYVDDAVRGIIATLKPEGRNDVFNLGSDRESSIREIVSLVCDAVDYKGRVVYDAAKPGGAARRALDSTKAKTALGFQARTNLAQGLETTYQWYLQNRG